MTTLATATAATAAALPLLAPVADAAPQTSDSDVRDRVVELVNAARAQAGCVALRDDPRLDAAAENHAEYMSAAGIMSHTGSGGSSFVARQRAEGVTRPGGENVAQGQRSADAVFTAWMNSPPHRKNILNCSFRTIGVAEVGSARYWAQEFGRG